jgi:hypothetical protein
MTTTKQIDSKGRILLGKRFAGETVLVEERPGGEYLLRPAVTVPAAEAWLWKNKIALASVRRGIEQASGDQFVAGPDLKADAASAEGMSDD